MVTAVLNEILAPFEPWQVAVGSAAVALLSAHAVRWAREFEFKNAFFRAVRKLPFVEAMIERELGKAMSETELELAGQMEGMEYNRRIPEKGWDRNRVIEEVNKMMQLGKFRVENGSLSGTCHKLPDEEKSKTSVEAYALAAFTNPLNPDAFPGIRKMEAEVVRMTIDLFNGDEEACGSMTSGGTESVLMACKAYRDLARSERGVKRPNMVVPCTAHVAFDKAGHYFGIEVRHVPLAGDGSMLPDLAQFERTIDSNTIMVLGSAPPYPHGTMDPIEAIAAIAVGRGIPMHVDACLGGFLIVFMEGLGYELQPFDFRVKGVTSISVDTHKFGYAPKGSSVVMYSSRKYIHHQYFCAPDWSGGIFVSPTMAGSRSGGIIAATWATLINNGLDGYREMTRAVVETTLFLAKGIAEIPGLSVLGNPNFCIVAFASNGQFHAYSLADDLKEKGWLFSCLQYPTCCHIYVTPMHTKPGIKERMLGDMKDSAKKLMAKPKEKLDGRAALYGMSQSIPDKGLVKEMTARFLDALYSTKGLSSSGD